MDNKIIHCKLLEILKVIDMICDKEKLTYMIKAGTLLGAIREKGFIEWDDDADIMMHRKDYNNFEVCCNKYLEDYGLFLDYHDRVPKVALKQDPQIHVDIFIIDALPNTWIKRKFKVLKLKLLQGMLKKDINYSQYNILGKLLVFGSWCLGRFFSEKSKLDNYKKISQAENNEGSNLVFISNDLYRFMDLEIDKNILKESIRVTFEDTKLTAPREWDAILKLYYGDDYIVPKRDNYYV